MCKSRLYLLARSPAAPHPLSRAVSPGVRLRWALPPTQNKNCSKPQLGLSQKANSGCHWKLQFESFHTAILHMHQFASQHATCSFVPMHQLFLTNYCKARPCNRWPFETEIYTLNSTMITVFYQLPVVFRSTGHRMSRMLIWYRARGVNLMWHWWQRDSGDMSHSGFCPFLHFHHFLSSTEKNTAWQNLFLFPYHAGDELFGNSALSLTSFSLFSSFCCNASFLFPFPILLSFTLKSTACGAASLSQVIDFSLDTME